MCRPRRDALRPLSRDVTAVGVFVVAIAVAACSEHAVTEFAADQHPGDAALDAASLEAGVAADAAEPAVACLPALARCDARGAVCCGSAVCTLREGAQRCVETCTSRFDCGSLCCADDAATGKKLCAAADACPPLPCSDVGGPCEQPGPTCCAGLACVSSTRADFAGCRKPCGASADCETGCCVAYTNGEKGFCAESNLCP